VWLKLFLCCGGQQTFQRPASDYLQTRQDGELTEKMRALTVNWMVEAAGRCDLLTETLFLAVDLFDRYPPPHATRHDTTRTAHSDTTLHNTTRHAWQRHDTLTWHLLN
jgi:hypothetical protein